MNLKNTFKILSFVFIISGLFLFVNSQTHITGAVIGFSESNYSFKSMMWGICLIGVAGILFLVGEAEETKDKKIKLTSTINNYDNLIKLAKNSADNQQVQKGLNHLIKELSKDNLEAGIGTKHLFKDIFYLRGRNGERVFYRKAKENNHEINYEIVGKASKHTEDKVINALKKIYF